MARRLPATKVCVWCGEGRARTIVNGGWAHKRCIPGNPGSGVEIDKPKRIKRKK